MKHPSSDSAQPTLNRRKFLQTTGRASLTLAAAQALAPFALMGCSSSSTRSVAGSTVKVGILHSLTGTMAISETSLQDVELMAIEEINASGGVLGKKIEAIVEDPESKFTDVFPEKAKKLLLRGQGGGRLRLLDLGQPQERPAGLREEQRPALLPGAVRGQRVLQERRLHRRRAEPADPAGGRVAAQQGGRAKKKFYLLGSDYIFPRTANLIIVKYLESKGMKPVAEKYTPLGHKDYATYVQDIKKEQPDVIFSTINGDSNSTSTTSWPSRHHRRQDPRRRRQRRRGRAARARPVEGQGPPGRLELLPEHRHAEEQEFVKKFQDKYGDDRVTDDPIEAAYFKVYFWKLAVEKAGSTDVDKVRDGPAVGHRVRRAGRQVKLDPKTQHTYKFFRMGRIRDDKQFDIVYTSPEAIEPDPYPQVAFPGWNCDWTKGGVTKGKQVEVSKTQPATSASRRLPRADPSARRSRSTSGATDDRDRLLAKRCSTA